MKNIYICGNKDAESAAYAGSLCKTLSEAGFNITENISDHTQLAIAVGGDGSVLRTVKALRYTDRVPVLGISTGNPGFFTEAKMNDTDMIRILLEEEYSLLEYRTIQTLAETEDGIFEPDPAVNDVMIRCKGSRMIHLNLYVGDTFTEYFSGDGLLISTAAGSTAYNYSLGGSIVDQRLALLQVTPAAPANNTVYKTLHRGSYCRVNRRS